MTKLAEADFQRQSEILSDQQSGHEISECDLGALAEQFVGSCPISSAPSAVV